MPASEIECFGCHTCSRANTTEYRNKVWRNNFRSRI